MSHGGAGPGNRANLLSRGVLAVGCETRERRSGTSGPGSTRTCPCGFPDPGPGPISPAVRDAYQGGQHRIDNGLLLRSDLHRLYDRGYVTVTPDYVFRVGDSLRDDFQNGRSYYGLDGQQIALPDRELWRPKRELLEWHGRNVFRG